VSNFREAQRQAHPTKTNTLLLGVMCVLILAFIFMMARRTNVTAHNVIEGIDVEEAPPVPALAPA
jgi:hypothetical protein